MNRVGMPLVMNVRKGSVASNFCDQVLPCASKDARPRSNMRASFVPATLQSDHSTEFCRDTAKDLNDKITIVHPCGMTSNSSNICLSAVAALVTASLRKYSNSIPIKFVPATVWK